MFRLFVLALGATLAFAQSPSSGCGKSLPEGQELGGFYNATVNNRRFVIFIPPDYTISEPAPLIVSYHGGSRSPENQIDLDLFTDSKYNTDKMVVYPEGTSLSNCQASNTCAERYWSVDPRITADDVAFTQSILDIVQDTYCLDTNRFYASGKSQGGGVIGSIFACTPALSNAFAAFAPVSGAFYTPNVSPCESPFMFPIPCNPGRTNIPIIEFHGGQDDVISYNGSARRTGACLPNIPWWVESWAVRDGLGMTGETRQLADDTPNTTITQYGVQQQKGLVTHVFDAVIKHVWPSKSTNSDNNGVVAEFDATPIIIDFFDAHTLA
ncbi:carbohydrate esterase family 1 protein [Stachybotrys elegans]|uniref:feruloyl esterase n=1 Tax=Stachybotrys elegans TaxID=80388 RepID=A0A8K0STF7_9HYPO|nr:carbohydrate esterase family 1 protein [Stachybotrys elegans]